MSDGATEMVREQREDELPPEESLADIEECFHPVVRQYGRAMFAVVINAGMAQQATQVLAQVLQNQHSKHGLHAVSMLANAFNQLSNAYVEIGRAHV